MANVLAVVEQKDGALRGVSREVVSAGAGLAGSLGGELHALALGGPGTGAAVGELGAVGAARVRVVEDERLSSFAPECQAAVVAAAVREGEYAAVLFGATAQGRDLAPRVAALLDVPLATDVTELEEEGGVPVAVRPVFSGKAFARVRSSAVPFLASLRPNVFPVRERAAAGTVDAWAPEIPEPRTRVREFRASEGTVDVGEAAVVIAGGRGLKDPENWRLLEELRDAIGEGTALGASRAVVDAGWRPHAEQVGQTGRTVAPRLYFAIGISGAIQHVAGMRTAGTIVAVNKDPDAPIFKIADYGIVGDLFEILPKLAEEVRALGRA